MKNTVEYLDALSTMTGTMTRSDALELFTLIAYLVKQHKDESENILLSTQDNISTFISDFVAEKELHWFSKDVIRWNANQLVNIVQVFLSLREECPNNQNYGEKAFEVLGSVDIFCSKK